MADYPTAEESLARLLRSGWSVGEVRTTLGWLVSGVNGENVVEARGSTSDQAWHRGQTRQRGPRAFPITPPLLHGPYCPPPLRKGDRTTCLLRDSAVIVTSWTDAPIAWRLRSADDDELALLGTMPDEAVAARIGRPVNAVRDHADAERDCDGGGRRGRKEWAAAGSAGKP